MSKHRTIGDRIRTLREFRGGVSQEQLAERAGVHVDTVRKLEQGVRATARIDTLRKIAGALDVELERLLGQPTVTPQQVDDGGLLALRDAIQNVGALPGVPAEPDLEDPPAVAAWIASVRHATRLYWEGGYSDLSAALPLLLRDGRAVVREAGSGPEAAGAWQQLALAYQLAACLCTQAGHTSWAVDAVRQQLAAARRASDPLMEGMGVSTLSWVLLRQGSWETAQQIAEAKAEALEPSFRRGTPAEFAVYGNLLTAAATPAARRSRRDEAMQLLGTAERAAERVGRPVHTHGSSFSVVDVQTQLTNIALAGEPAPAEALTQAARVDVGAISRPVHAAAHRVDVAQAQYLTGDADGALDTLLEVEEDQPEWIKYQVIAGETVREMLEAERRRNAPLRGLAGRLGVDPTL
ncbi:helix-turn-helix transcriptional regulator [Streptomyces synnematoformans]|uniref:HTH cro/C1-type domain-containing protein n=1 Tax=Streptomyces synnematoformans TaxID=415721 RepID=A0ABN1ZMR4_9ACTN